MRTARFHRIAVFCAGVCVACALQACAPITPADRIAQNPVIFQSLTPAQQLLVQQGRIEKGMTPNAVLLAWGAPDSQIHGEKDGRKLERWIYRGYETVTVMSDPIGPYMGPYGWYDPFYPRTSTAYVPTQAAYVEFVNGKVSSWEKVGQ